MKKGTKELLALLLCLVLCFSLFPASALAAGEIMDEPAEQAAEAEDGIAAEEGSLAEEVSLLGEDAEQSEAEGEIDSEDSSQPADTVSSLKGDAEAAETEIVEDPAPAEEPETVDEAAAEAAFVEEPAEVLRPEAEAVEEKSEPEEAADAGTLVATVSGNVISWNTYPGAQSYMVHYRLDTEGGGFVAGSSETLSAAVTSYDISSLLGEYPSQTLRVYVSAFGTNGERLAETNFITIDFVNTYSRVTKTVITASQPVIGQTEAPRPKIRLYDGSKTVNCEYQFDAGWYFENEVGGHNPAGQIVPRSSYTLIVHITLPEDVYLANEYEGVAGSATVNGNSTKMLRTYGDHEYRVLYKFPATPNGIYSAAVTIPTPKVGDKPSYSPTIPSGVHYSLGNYNNDIYRNDVTWYDNTAKKFMTPETDVFQSGHEYEVRVNLLAESGYQFSEKATGTINGNSAVFWNYPTGMVNTAGVPVGAFEYTFPALTAGQQTGWNKDADGKWIYYKSDGSKATGWEKIGGVWYYFNASGIMQTGWQKISSKWYYFKSSGAMVTGWQKISNKRYFFNSSGAMQTGWVKDGGKWYYMNSSGAMQTGWVKDGGKWYYMNSSGAMQTGWVKDGGKWYYMNSSGVMQTGWQKISGKWYYFESSGAMVTGSKTIGGKTYNFDSSGVCLNP